MSDAVRAGACIGCCCGVGRENEDTEGFFRSWVFDAGDRSWGWLLCGRSTGSREVAGRGMPEGLGRFEDWSMASGGCFSGQRRTSCVVGCTRGLLEHSRRDWPPLVSHNFQADGSNAGRRDRPDVTALARCWSDGMVRMSGDV
jgi:hypothetical protein